METQTTDLRITERALGKLHEIARAEGMDLGAIYLRVAVVPGGCSGLTYDLGWDSARQEQDRETDFDGLRVLMDRKTYLHIEGTELDFTEGLEGKGFHFLNPQATRTCACGESFGL